MLGIAVASCTEAAICGHAGNWEKKKGKGLVLREGCGSQRHADSLRIPGTQEGASLAQRQENWQRSASAGPGNNVKDTHSLPKCLDLILFGFSKKNI